MSIHNSPYEPSPSERPTLRYTPEPVDAITSGASPSEPPPEDDPRASGSKAQFGLGLAVGGAVAFGFACAAWMAPSLTAAVSHAPAASVATAVPTPTPVEPLTAVVPEDVALPRAGQTAAAAALPTSSPSVSSRAQNQPRGTRAALSASARRQRRLGSLGAIDRRHNISGAPLVERLVSGRAQRVPRNPPTGDVRSFVIAHRRRLRQCYTLAIRRTGIPRDVHVRIELDILPSGSVSNIEYQGEDFGHLGICLQRSVAQWQFSPSREGAHVPIPLSFTTVQN